MGRFLKYSAASFAMLLCIFSCKREGHVIPRDTLAQIYAEMLVADQLISQDSKIRRTADTTLVYEPIFQKYGYTSDDYRASMARYIKDPDRYARILRRTGVIIEERLKELKEEKKILDSIMKLKDEIDSYAPERIFALTGLNNPGLCVSDSLSFYLDSAGGEYFFDTREWLDTAFYGPEVFVAKDTVSVVADTSLVVGDTVRVLREDTVEMYSGQEADRSGARMLEKRVQPNLIKTNIVK